MINMFNKKIKVYFIAQYQAGIDKFYSVVKEMQKDPKFDVKVLAVPNDIKDLSRNKEYDYWYNKFGDITIDSIQDGKWYNLKKQKPDYVFIQRPYDIYVPNEYKKETMFEYTKICYIPYGFPLANIFFITYTLEDAKKVNIIFSEHDISNAFYHEQLKEINDGIDRKIANLGFPSLDEAKKKVDNNTSVFNNIENKVNVNFLWAPRWTTDKDAVETSFFDYKESIIKYFKKNNDCKLVFRPHPLTFKNFIEKKLMSEKEVKDYLNRFKDNMYYDNTEEYLDTFRDTDVLIGDFSSIIIEFFLYNKPVIYTQKVPYNKNSYMEKLEKVFYHVKNEKELFKELDNLRKGIDPLKEKREKLAKELFANYDGKVAYRIKEYIKNDYEKN